MKLAGKSVLITGGTGSFGSKMANHLLSLDVDEVRIFSRDESKQDTMRHDFEDARLKFYIGDVRDEQSVRQCMAGVDYVFHAAALKQVPTAEFFPLEAVATNVLGSANVLRSAIHAGVKSMVCLSTDKAVYPINAMGQSKALMEKTASSFARHNLDSPTRISITRYGNVMASRGSVIPLFIRQIKSKVPLTLTQPQMTRFLMSLDESVDLVLHAFKSEFSGDLFVKKAPAADLETLVAAVKDLLGVPEYPVNVIGVRHGEKLYESLLSAEEAAIAIDEGDFFRVPLDTRSLNYSIFTSEGFNEKIHEAYTSHNTERLTKQEVIEKLLTLPEIVRELN
jgi:UDP-glucose 4-epimerase